jgi:DNA helicase HerA-like ATPase
MKQAIFDEQSPIGILKGFSPLPEQLEVDVIMPADDRIYPRFGEFLLIEVDQASALVGRVSRVQAAGQLMTEQGERYLADLAGANQDMPATVARQLLRYTIKMQLLGKLSLHSGSRFEFSVGERAFSSMGRRVRRPSREALNYLCNVGLDEDPTAVPLGELAYGQHVEASVKIKISIDRLKGRRSFVFARAGYGKSNLIKSLVSQLYATPPEVGLLIIDPEGEYAFPDVHGRLGLVNVPGLEKRTSVYSSRNIPSQYRHCHKGDTFLDFADFPPQDIVAGFIPAEKQDGIFANLLRGMDWSNWKQLVTLLDEQGYRAPDQAIATLLEYSPNPRRDDVSLAAIKNNLIPALNRVHRPGSTLSKNVIQELREHRVVIIDTSLMTGEDSLAITGILLRRIFYNNVRHFTDPAGQTVRCLTLVEEAQTMLGDRNLDDRNIFVRWVKEGRKFGLGCILVTQQPGSISHQIISQGDNFFVLHLLNRNDLEILQRHNAHYTDDILGFIRNEPIQGNCYFWSAPNQPYVLPVRVASFESVARVTPAQPSHVVEETTDRQAVPELATLVEEAIAKNGKVWVYPVGRIYGQTEPGHVAFSVDYLYTAVLGYAERDRLVSRSTVDRGAFGDELRGVVSKRLSELGGRFGFAVLQGIKRPVCVLSESNISLSGSKQLQSETIDIDRAL